MKQSSEKERTMEEPLFKIIKVKLPAEEDPYALTPYGDVLPVPPAPPELEEQWLAEARSRLRDPESDAPAVHAYLCGCIHARRLLYHEDNARRILQELSITDPR